jgi:hypothetical protein
MKKYTAKITAKNPQNSMELNNIIFDYITYSLGLVKSKGCSHILRLNIYCPCTAKCDAGSFEALLADAPKETTRPVPVVGRTRRMTLS